VAVTFTVAVAVTVTVAVTFTVAVTAPERGSGPPRVERRLVPPPRHHQPRRAAVRWLKQLEALEAVLLVDGSRARGEPAGQLVSAIGGHSDRVDFDNRHTLTLRPPRNWQPASSRFRPERSPRVWPAARKWRATSPNPP
jgi:hypothetical protein